MIPRGTAGLVILDHRGHGPRHQDWLFGRGPRLPTWRVDGLRADGIPWAHGRRACIDPASWHLPRAWRWSDPHRPRYRTFRGPVPGGRGAVAVIFRGAVTIRDACGGLLLTVGRPGGRVLFARDGRVHRLRGA